ncbi:MAG: hypothetical protein Q4F98_04180 [Lachnospiraceae bacterium]|nr:hypothetical protein [Lachnospiraceae bacterium]
MRKTRRWLALLLAVVLVSSNVIYQLGTDMSASESENVTEEAEQKSDSTEEKVQKEEVPDTQDQKDSGEVTVQELDSHSKRAASDDSAKARTVEKAKSAEKTETKSEEKKEQTAKKEESKKADATDSDSKETKKDTEEKSYEMTIQKSELDGGSIKAWGANGSKETVTYKDSKYLKTIKSGEDFHFEITVKDSFKLDKVTNQHNNTIQPQKVEGNVYTYRVADVKADKSFHVLYKEETSSKKNDSDNAKSDNKKDDADASDDGESDSKADEDKNVSAASEKGKIATVADTDTTRTIRVGQTVTLDSSDRETPYSEYTHKWTVADGNKVRLNKNSGSSITITGLNAGQTTVTDKYTWTLPLSWNTVVVKFFCNTCG